PADVTCARAVTVSRPARASSRRPRRLRRIRIERRVCARSVNVRAATRVRTPRGRRATRRSVTRHGRAGRQLSVTRKTPLRATRRRPLSSPSSEVRDVEAGGGEAAGGAAGGGAHASLPPNAGVLGTIVAKTSWNGERGSPASKFGSRVAAFAGWVALTNGTARQSSATRPW